MLPHIRPSLLLLAAVLFAPAATAAQTDPFTVMAAQVDHVARAAKMAEAADPRGFVQLRGDKKLFDAIASKFANVAPTPCQRSGGKMEQISKRLAELQKSSDGMLAYEANSKKALAAAQQMIAATPSMLALLDQLQALQMESAPKGGALAATKNLIEWTRNIDNEAKRFVKDHGFAPEGAFLVGRSQYQFTSAMQKMLEGDRETRIAPATVKETAKITEIRTLVDTERAAIAFLLNDLSPSVRFRQDAAASIENARVLKLLLDAAHACTD
jgi:hypothetical protein